MTSLPLIGLAHGSRHLGVRPAIDELVAAVAAAEGIPAHAAYLDLAEPDLAAVALELAAAGHRTAVVVPLLFTSAFHATVDVPQAIAEAATTSGLDLVMGSVLGTGSDVRDLLTEVMAEAAITADQSVLLYAVGSSNEAANDDVHDLADALAAGRDGAVRVGFGTAEPRAEVVLTELREPIALVPLFLAPGLLLAPMEAMAAERGWITTGPLAERAAPIVRRRYRDRAALVSPLD